MSVSDPDNKDKPNTITPEQIEAAGPDTLRHLLSVEMQRNQKLQELLKFARDAMKSATGNLIAFEERMKSWEDLVAQYRVK